MCFQDDRCNMPVCIYLINMWIINCCYSFVIMQPYGGRSIRNTVVKGESFFHLRPTSLSNVMLKISYDLFKTTFCDLQELSQWNYRHFFSHLTGLVDFTKRHVQKREREKGHNVFPSNYPIVIKLCRTLRETSVELVFRASILWSHSTVLLLKNKKTSGRLCQTCYPVFRTNLFLFYWQRFRLSNHTTKPLILRKN